MTARLISNCLLIDQQHLLLQKMDEFVLGCFFGLGFGASFDCVLVRLGKVGL